MNVSPYLTFPGTCGEAMRFYAEVFGSRDLVVMPSRGSPMEAEVPEAARDRVMHARLTVGSTSLMASDAPADRYTTPAGFSVSLHPTEVEEAERIFAALAGGGTVTLPLQQTFWARRFGAVTDRFGTPWMLNCE